MPDSAVDPATRWLGAAGALGGALWAAFPIWFLSSLYVGGVTSLLNPLGGLLLAGLFVPLLLMAAGTVGLYRSHRDRFGAPGRWGIGLTLAGFAAFAPVFLIGRSASLAWLVPTGVYGGFGALSVGAVLLAIGLRRADRIPIFTATLLAVAIPLGVLVGGVVLLLGRGPAGLAAGLILPYGLAWGALGTAIWRLGETVSAV